MQTTINVEKLIFKNIDSAIARRFTIKIIIDLIRIIKDTKSYQVKSLTVSPKKSLINYKGNKST